MPFYCTYKELAIGIINLIDNLEGQQSDYWGHELNNSIMLFIPFLKHKIIKYK